MRISPYTAVLAYILLTSLAGCNVDPSVGYTTANQYRPGIRSVSVPIWTRGKDVYRRELEMRLTEAIVKRIETDTPYKVTTRARADTLLTGRIDEIVQQVMSTNPDTGRARELELTIEVSFTWKDLRTGEILVDRENFRIARPYIVDEPIAEDFFEGSAYLINQLAKRIVEQMEAEW